MSMTCHDCQAQMVAYINNELSPRGQRQVHNHLNTCSRCTMLYLAERDLRRDLREQLPHMGRASQPRLESMWSAIQNEMTLSDQPTLRLNERTGYSMVVLLLVLSLMLPLSMRARQSNLNWTLTLNLNNVPNLLAQQPVTPSVSAADHDDLLMAETVAVPLDGAVITVEPDHAPRPTATDVP